MWTCLEQLIYSSVYSFSSCLLCIYHILNNGGAMWPRQVLIWLLSGGNIIYIHGEIQVAPGTHYRDILPSLGFKKGLQEELRFKLRLEEWAAVGKVQRRVSKAERTACTKDYIRESMACLRNFKECDIARKGWKVKRKKKKLELERGTKGRLWRDLEGSWGQEVLCQF